jgi:hypothetical protein
VELELMEQTGLTAASTSGMIQTGGWSWWQRKDKEPSVLHLSGNLNGEGSCWGLKGWKLLLWSHMFPTGPLHEACKITHILHHWNSSMRVRYQHEFYQKTGNILMLVMRAQGSGIGEGFAGIKESPTCIFLVFCFWYRQLRFRFSNWHHFLWNSCCRLKKSVFVSKETCCRINEDTTYWLVFMSYAYSNANRYPRAPSPDSRNVEPRFFIYQFAFRFQQIELQLPIANHTARKLICIKGECSYANCVFALITLIHAWILLTEL